MYKNSRVRVPTNLCYDTQIVINSSYFLQFLWFWTMGNSTWPIKCDFRHSYDHLLWIIMDQKQHVCNEQRICCLESFMEKHLHKSLIWWKRACLQEYLKNEEHLHIQILWMLLRTSQKTKKKQWHTECQCFGELCAGRFAYAPLSCGHGCIHRSESSYRDTALIWEIWWQCSKPSYMWNNHMHHFPDLACSMFFLMLGLHHQRLELERSGLGAACC